MKLPVLRVGGGGWLSVEGEKQEPVELYISADGVVIAGPRKQKEEKK